MRARKRLLLIIFALFSVGLAAFFTAITRQAGPRFTPVSEGRSRLEQGTLVAARSNGGHSFIQNTTGTPAKVNFEHVEKEPNTGVVKRVSMARPKPGPGAIPRDRAEEEARRIALEFLAENREEFAIENIQDVKIVGVSVYDYPEEHKDRGFDMSVRSIQTHQGFPVLSSFNHLVMDNTGKVFIAKNKWSPGITAPATPVLTEKDAVAGAQRDLQTKIKPAGKPELWVLPADKLVYRINFHSPVGREVLVDALTGQVIRKRPNVMASSTQVTGDVLDQDGEGLDSVDADFYFLGLPYSNDRTNSSGSFSDSFSLYVPGAAYVRSELDSEISSGGDSASNEIYDSEIKASKLIDETSDWFGILPGDHITIDPIRFNQVTSDEDQDEGGVLLREMNRALRYVNDNWNSYLREGTLQGVVRASEGPNSGGSYINLPDTRAVLDNGNPTVGTTNLIDDTMLHEYGHSLQWKVYGDTWAWGNCEGRTGSGSACNASGCSTGAGGDCPNHGGTGNACSCDAFSEGWAEYFPLAVYDNYNANDTSYGWSDSSNERNLETNCNDGKLDEWAFARLLWDIKDGVNSSDNDNLSLGEDEIWHIMEIAQPYTVDEFREDFLDEYPQYKAKFNEIWATHVGGVIQGHAYNDEDRDGEWDAGEDGLSNWEITITDSAGNTVNDDYGDPVDTEMTDSDGYYNFINLAARTYKVSIDPPDGWDKRIPDNGEQTIALSANTLSSEHNFGVYEYGNVNEFGGSYNYSMSAYWTSPYDLETNEERTLFGSSPAIWTQKESVRAKNSYATQAVETLKIVSGSDESENWFSELSADGYGIWRVFNGHYAAAKRVAVALDTQSGPAMSSPNLAYLNQNTTGFPQIIGGTAGFAVESAKKLALVVTDQLDFTRWTSDAAWTFPPVPQGGNYVFEEFTSSPAATDVIDSSSLAGAEVIIGNTSSQYSDHNGVWAFDGDNSDGADDEDTMSGAFLDTADVGVFAPGTEGADWDLLWKFTTLKTSGPMPLVLRKVGKVYSTPAVDDIDADGDKEVVFGDTEGNVYSVSAASGTLEWKLATGDAVYGSPGIADFDGNGDKEVVIGSTDGNVYFVDGDSDGDQVIDLGSEATRTSATVQSGLSLSNQVYSSPAIARTPVWNETAEKLEATTALSIYIGSGSPYPRTRYPDADNISNGRSAYSGALHKFRYNPGSNRVTREWDYDGPGTENAAYMRPVISSPSLGLTCSENQFSLSGSSGNKWETPWPMFRQNSARTGSREIQSGEDDEDMYVYTGDDDGVLHKVHATFGPDFPEGVSYSNDTFRTGGAIRSSPAIGDVDGDGVMETSFYDWGFNSAGSPTSKQSRFWVLTESDDCGHWVLPPTHVGGFIDKPVTIEDDLVRVDIPSLLVDPADAMIYLDYILERIDWRPDWPIPTDYTAAGPIIEIFPKGLVFPDNKPAVLTFTFNAGVNPRSVEVFWYNQQASSWEKVTKGRLVNPLTRQIRVEANHFSVYGVFSGPPTPATGLNTPAAAAIGIGLLVIGVFVILGPKAVRLPRLNNMTILASRKADNARP